MIVMISTPDCGRTTFYRVAVSVGHGDPQVHKELFTHNFTHNSEIYTTMSGATERATLEEQYRTKIRECRQAEAE